MNSKKESKKVTKNAVKKHKYISGTLSMDKREKIRTITSDQSELEQEILRNKERNF